MEEVPAESRRPAVATAIALLALTMLALAGCGNDSADGNSDPQASAGPLEPAGDIVTTPATLRAEAGLTTLGVAQIRARGPSDALILAQTELDDTGEAPRFRLLVDGEPERNTEVTVVRNGATRTAVVSCACELSPGDHDVVFEGTAESGTTRVGARSLAVFAGVDLEDANSAPIIGSELATGEAAVRSEGTSLASTRPRQTDGPMVIVAGIRSPLGQTAAGAVRLEVVVGDEQAQELAVTTIPSGKLVAYLDPDGAEVGEEVTLQGYVSSGRGIVSVATLAVCACGIPDE